MWGIKKEFVSHFFTFPYLPQPHPKVCLIVHLTFLFLMEEVFISTTIMNCLWKSLHLKKPTIPLQERKKEWWKKRDSQPFSSVTFSTERRGKLPVDTKRGIPLLNHFQGFYLSTISLQMQNIKAWFLAWDWVWPSCLSISGLSYFFPSLFDDCFPTEFFYEMWKWIFLALVSYSSRATYLSTWFPGTATVKVSEATRFRGFH